MMRYFWLTLLFFSCTRPDEAEREKMKARNAKSEYIYRNPGDTFAPIVPPAPRFRERYSWEEEIQLPKITREYFRCKGSRASPPLIDPYSSEPRTLLDCDRHGLPLIHGKEGVYPILLELLNYLQKTTGKRVIITCGHRCPTHNAYADPSKENRVSKHQIGAEVDFYVQGLEDQPEKVVQLIQTFYQQTPRYKGKGEYQSFQRYEKADARVETPPWFNKEIYIKLYKKHEGRDADNRHLYPYLSLQVRHDREKDVRVAYDWKLAKNYTSEK